MIFTNLIKTNLKTKLFGKEVAYYQRLNSTNKEAWELIKNGEAKHGMIIVTDNQFNGKGRNGNQWFMAPSKGLSMSIILKHPISIDNAQLLPIAAAVAVAKALENRGLNPELKWPNDILLNNKKCGGILCESKIANQVVSSLIIGIGLNVNENIDDFPEPLNQTATSLAIETGHSIQRELVCAIITTFFERLHSDLNNCINHWLKYCLHLNKPVSFKFQNKSYDGIFQGINSEGKAIIYTENKKRLFSSIIIE